MRTRLLWQPCGAYCCFLLLIAVTHAKECWAIIFPESNKATAVIHFSSLILFPWYMGHHINASPSFHQMQLCCKNGTQYLGSHGLCMRHSFLFCCPLSSGIMMVVLYLGMNPNGFHYSMIWIPMVFIIHLVLTELQRSMLHSPKPLVEFWVPV